MYTQTKSLVVELFYGIGVLSTLLLIGLLITTVYDEYIDPQVVTTSLQCKG